MITDEGQWQLNSDGIVHIDEFMDVDETSDVAGRGEIVFTDELNNGGTHLNFRGRLTPIGPLLKLTAANGAIDLDGSGPGGEAAVLDLTLINDGALQIDAALTDPFSGTIRIARANTALFFRPWQLDGELAFLSLGTGTSTLSAPLVDVLAGGIVRSSADNALVNSEIHFNNGSDVAVNAGSRLEIDGTTRRIAVLHDNAFDGHAGGRAPGSVPVKLERAAGQNRPRSRPSASCRSRPCGCCLHHWLSWLWAVRSASPKPAVNPKCDRDSFRSVRWTPIPKPFSGASCSGRPLFKARFLIV